MYGEPNSSNVNDVRFYVFSKTYQSKELDDNFENKCRSFDSSNLPPCKAELYQHSFRVRGMMRINKRNVYRQPDGPQDVRKGIDKEILKNQLF
ncbi:hypothetical protein TNCV_3248191 [Trichonephila clavipes]|nr:hypothetical protein TNCV_3248191 [Trichonephila clavipes]